MLNLENFIFRKTMYGNQDRVLPLNSILLYLNILFLLYRYTFLNGANVYVYVC